MTKSRTFLLTTCIASLSLSSAQTNGSRLRGVQPLPPRQQRTRQLPQNEAVKKENDRRKKQNKAIVNREDEEWKGLGKEEKKKLLLELEEEEGLPQEMTQEAPVEALGVSGAAAQGGQQAGPAGQAPGRVSGSQLAYLQQYFHSLDSSDSMEMQSSSVEDKEWQDLTKAEKKQIIEMMNKEVKLSEVDYDKLTKQEKKELMKAEKEEGGGMLQNSEFVEEEGAGGTSGGGASSGGIDNAADFGGEGTESQEGMAQNSQGTGGNGGGNDGIDNAGDFAQPGKLTVEDVMGKDEEDMTQNSNEADGFVLPMPQLTSGNEGADTASDFAQEGEMTINSETSTTGDAACPGCYAFATSLPDPSTQLDSFDPSSMLKWTMSGLAWNTVESSSVDDGCSEGDSCIESGIVSDLELDGEEPTYSNLTLTTEEDFEGGVLSFMVAGDGFAMPREAFVVAVDDEVAVSTSSLDGSWSEYSVSVGQGKHTVTWSHVYNPLGLEALPEKTGEMGLRMDDLRFSPFDKMNEQGFEDDKGKGLVMTSDGDAVWQVNDEDSNSGKYSIVASTSEISNESGSSNINFVLFSEYGGTLKYKISSSTTAPHDDFAILLNHEPAEAIFGLMPNFDYRSVDVPMGKVVVTLQHRKNPGNLSTEVLEALGKVSTEGMTRLDDIRFEPADNRLN